MSYWLCITNEENWNVIKQKKVWGVQEKHRKTIGNVKPSDKCLIYVMSTKKGDELIPPRIIGPYRVFKALARGRNETSLLSLRN